MMPLRLPTEGDLIRIRPHKTWYWYKCDCLTRPRGLHGVPLWWRRSISEIMPRESIIVVSIRGTTVHFLHEGRFYHVTAEREEHIINDFEIVSGMDWCQD